MDKISGILPTSARIKSVDLKNSGALRPGTPSFGRPEGVSTLSPDNKESTAMRANKLLKEHMATRNDPRAQIVKDVSNGFFINNRVSAPQIEAIVQEVDSYVDFSQPDEYQVKAGEEMQSYQQEVGAVPAPAGEATQEMSEAELDMPEIGRYLDVSV